MFYDTLLALCKQNNVKITNVIKELNMSSGNMTRWKNGVIPHGDNLKRLAEYFGVSTDYLLGNEKEQTSRAIGENTVLYRKKGDVVEEKYSDEQMEYVEKFLKSIKEK